MYKIYIETENDSEFKAQMDEMAGLIARELLLKDNMIVYINGINLTRQDISEINLSAYIKLQDKSSSKGFEVKINELSKVSNGLGKEIYKEMRKVYYDKNEDKGVMYVNEKIGIQDVPSVLINLINKTQKENIEWLENNMIIIAKAISDGIKKSFVLKQC